MLNSLSPESFQVIGVNSKVLLTNRTKTGKLAERTKHYKNSMIQPADHLLVITADHSSIHEIISSENRHLLFMPDFISKLNISEKQMSFLKNNYEITNEAATNLCLTTIDQNNET